MKIMLSQKKIEEDYKTFENVIDQMIQEERRKIREKIARTKVEVENIGEAVENNLTTDDDASKKKKS